jgi:hypothetical protein
MRQTLFGIAFVTTVLFMGRSSALGSVSLTFGGNAGVYTLPKEVNGYIDGYASTYNRYIWAESGINQYGYTQQTYKYKHPFPSRTLPNIGVNFGLSYIFQSRIGIFIEGNRTFSVLDKRTSQSFCDSLPGDQFATIPHDYRTRITESDDRLYMKSFQMGIGLSYSVPLKKKASLIFAGSFGRAYYSQYFRVETVSITTNYYQNNGHLIYSEKNGQGSFDVFGIRYIANCFKPAMAIEWDLKSPLSARIGLAYPISLIEKGEYFTENSDNYSTAYYPSSRFWAGNVTIDASISLNFGKGGHQ